jgi:biopolymer transport protein ExbD
MALKLPPKPASMTLNLAPMVDVLMCLIIFFLLASEMATRETAVNLAWARAAKEVKPSELGQRVTITVRRAGDSDEKAEYVTVDWDGQQIVERVLSPTDLENLLKLRAARAQADKQELRCVIRADQAVMYQHVEVVLRACGLAKVGNIVFTAYKGAGPKEPA